MALEHWQTIEGHFNFQSVYSQAVERFPSGSTFVEVGSYFGCSAAYLASRIRASGKDIKLVCIDVWKDFDPGQQLFDAFVENMIPYRGIVSWHRAQSIEACKLFQDGTLDFVFLDADHNYQSVKDDIRVWSPKLKTGGLLAGHDYSPADAVDTTFEGVGRAVREIFGTDFTVVGNTWIRA